MLAFTLSTPLPFHCHHASPLSSPRRPLVALTPNSEEASASNAAAATFILQRAATGYLKGGTRPAASTVKSALLQLEKEQNKHKVKIEVDKLYGHWRLVLIANPRTENIFTSALYFPLMAQQNFVKEENVVGDVPGGVFYNGVFLFGGWTNFRVWGPFRWVSKGNRLEFTVDSVSASVGGLKWKKEETEEGGLEGKTTKDLPFFKFFCVGESIAAARGRSGGLALYARVPEGEEL